ncbi:response regulator transcription factor [Maribellus comscasis]|uniref:response regulator transcription factor n=1 Tax=Maribellus comscasis TaxID=2681766 RepID=UPI003CCD187B
MVQKLTRLAPREKQVLELISEGHKSAQIAEKLFISINTVNNHRRNDREIKCFKYA